MDSGNDAAENLGILIEDGSWFVIKRNLVSAEKKEDWGTKLKGCKCMRCVKTKDEGLSWDGCKCTHCGKERN